MKSIDDVPYALVGAVLAAVGFLVGNLFYYRYDWQLIVAPVIGAIFGFLVGVLVLRDKRLRFSATMGEFKAAMKKSETDRPS